MQNEYYQKAHTESDGADVWANHKVLKMTDTSQNLPGILVLK